MAGLKKTRIKEKKERKQIKKENRVAKNLLLLNPGNLAKEVYTYGYHFSWKTHLFVIGACIAGMGVIGLLFQLKWKLLVIVLIAMFLALPAFILDTYKKMYEQKRFADAATYMEQMLYAFQKTGKVLSALKEARETFEPGHMRDIMDESIGHLEAGHSYSEKSVLRESLDIVEKEYECRTDRICILFLSYFPIQMIEAENHNIIPHPCIIFTDIFSDSDRLAFLAVCPGRIILCHKLCASTAKNTLRRKIDKPAFL